MVVLFLIALCLSHDVCSFSLGIENSTDIFFFDARKYNWSILLVTNQTGITQAGKRTIDVLKESGLKLVYIAAPEHGITGTVSAGSDVHQTVDSITNIPVLSLYKNGTGAFVDSALLSDIDCICFDMQDCGMRHYTVISTLYRLMESASVSKKRIVVFDRPHFLGSIVHGPLVDQNCVSFISIAPIPLRYGLTIGELSRYFNHYFFDDKVNLHVVHMKDYDCNTFKCLSMLKPLSPNIQSLQACYGYSFLGILGEIRPFDVSIGTPQAFTCLMLPESLPITKYQWNTLQKKLMQYGIDSKISSYYSNRKRMMMIGLRFIIKDAGKIPSISVVYTVIAWAQSCGVPLHYADNFHKVIGTIEYKKFLSNETEFESWYKHMHDELAVYKKRAESIRLYPSFSMIQI